MGFFSPVMKFERKVWRWPVTLVLALLMWGAASGISYFADPEAVFWREVLRDREMRAKLARERAQGEPVIFVGGGSSCSFSVHPDVLGEVTGFQAVNLGGSAGMGYRYLVDLATAHAKRGDIVILQVEPGIFRGGEGRMTPLAVKMDLSMGVRGCGRGVFKGALYEKPFLEKIKALKPGARFMGVLCAKLLKPGPMYLYEMEGMRENGTLSVVVDQANPDRQSFQKMSQWADELAVQEDLRRMGQYARKNGIRVFYTLPWESYDERSLADQRVEHDAYLSKIEKYLPVLRDAMMGAVGDNDLFLDSGFHMTEKGGRFRSQALGEALNLALAEEK